MDQRWQDIERIYHTALELDGSARAEFLAKTCAGNAGLRDEVESLLAHGDQAGSYLETPPIEMAAKALGKAERSPAASTAALEPGMMVAHYRLAARIGAGGMGEVYRARDTKLQRDVALKILPQALAHDAERMARFEREAQVLASLNHPSIAAIYGLEESNGIRALAMELVEGATLAEKIVGEGSALPRERSGEFTSPPGGVKPPLPLGELLPIAKQIAEALEYAHERGVIHRDLKPANVKITPEGTVKVLDFGLAKVLSGTGAPPVHGTGGHATDQDSPTLSMTGTEPGMLLGTAAYMSPEQARGQRVDRRTDIWAFGCVLYETLSGRKAFDGETISDVLAAVITKEPEWTALPATTPLPIQKLIRRCLQKDIRQRLQAIGDARIAIEETLAGDVGERSALPREGYIATGPLPLGEGGPGERDRVRVPPLRRALPWVLALVAVVALAGWWRANRTAAPPPSWSGELLPGPSNSFLPRVSPDGHLLAFQAIIDNVAQVAVMDPAAGNWTVLTHDRTHGPTIGIPCWSRDGSTIYFDRIISQPVGVYSVPALGGEERLVLANAASPQALPDGSLLVVRVDPDRRYQIYHYWPDTGRLEALGAWVIAPWAAPLRVFPDGNEAIFVGRVKGGADEAVHLYLLHIATARTERLPTELPSSPTSLNYPLAVTPDGRSILIDLPSGNLHRIVAIPRSGKGSVQTLLTLSSMPMSLDTAPDGSLYIDRVDRPLEFLKFPPSGGTPKVLASIDSYTMDSYGAPVQFSDGRLVLPTIISGRPCLLLSEPGRNAVPLLATNEETWWPTRVSEDEVALLGGNPEALAIASVKEGRIIHRFNETEGKDIGEVAASPDGKSIYYVSSGSVWSIPTQGGSSRRICAGDGVVADPNGRELIVKLNEQEHVRLERVPLSGGPARPIQVRSNLPMAPYQLSPDALNKDGKLVVTVAPKDSWFFGTAILDLATGKLKPVPLNYTFDVAHTAWASDGSILATGAPIRAHIWRFRPVH